MPSFTLRSRAPRGERSNPRAIHDRDVIAGHLEDAAHYHGGHATALFAPATEAEIAAILRNSPSVLPIGAQSSLTGGATPMGDVLINTRRLNAVRHLGIDRVRVQAGVTLIELDEALAQAGRYYPPAPTFRGAFIGGTLSTNAAGAATFKYGTTRDWVESLTVVLASGDVLDIDRGATRAHPDGYFELVLSRGSVRVPVPSYQMPAVDKLSAGYFAEPGMDLIDLFIGSEGTLGIITEATLRVVPVRPAFCLAFVTFNQRSPALAFVRRLREAARNTWARADVRGIDVSAIEHMDARSLQLLREDGLDVQHGVSLPHDSTIALLVTLDLPPGMTSERGYTEIGSFGSAEAPDTPLVRFCALLAEYGVTERTVMALPGDRAQAAQLLEVREAVPAAVNRRVGLAKRDVDGRIEKTAADMIVPFEQFEAMLQVYERELAERGLDAAIWGHISDGNVHPNVIPRTFADVVSGRDAMLAFGRETIRLGGAPLAEHGVGRNPTKQKLLKLLYGDAGIDNMRHVKAALDPEWKLSPDVIFAKVSDTHLTP
jgi:D-lactate dehydrogenase (cytochrome)